MKADKIQSIINDEFLDFSNYLTFTQKIRHRGKLANVEITYEPCGVTFDECQHYHKKIIVDLKKLSPAEPYVGFQALRLMIHDDLEKQFPELKSKPFDVSINDDSIVSANLYSLSLELEELRNACKKSGIYDRMFFRALMAYIGKHAPKQYTDSLFNIFRLEAYSKGEHWGSDMEFADAIDSSDYNLAYDIAVKDLGMWEKIGYPQGIFDALIQCADVMLLKKDLICAREMMFEAWEIVTEDNQQAKLELKKLEIKINIEENSLCEARRKLRKYVDEYKQHNTDDSNLYFELCDASKLAHDICDFKLERAYAKEAKNLWEME